MSVLSSTAKNSIPSILNTNTLEDLNKILQKVTLNFPKTEPNQPLIVQVLYHKTITEEKDLTTVSIKHVSLTQLIHHIVKTFKTFSPQYKNEQEEFKSGSQNIFFKGTIFITMNNIIPLFEKTLQHLRSVILENQSKAPDYSYATAVVGVMLRDVNKTLEHIYSTFIDKHQSHSNNEDPIEPRFYYVKNIPLAGHHYAISPPVSYLKAIIDNIQLIQNLIFSNEVLFQFCDLIKKQNELLSRINKINGDIGVIDITGTYCKKEFKVEIVGSSSSLPNNQLLELRWKYISLKRKIANQVLVINSMSFARSAQS